MALIALLMKRLEKKVHQSFSEWGLWLLVKGQSKFGEVFCQPQVEKELFPGAVFCLKYSNQLSDHKEKLLFVHLSSWEALTPLVPRK